MVDEQAAQGRRIGRVVGQELVYLVLIVEVVGLEALAQHRQGGEAVPRTARERGEAAVTEEGDEHVRSGVARNGHGGRIGLGFAPQCTYGGW